MLTLKLRFLAGRYHATPWGFHVNEGLVEWPPSPWRLLRALVAVGYATQHWRAIPGAGRRLVETLASRFPRYRLSRASVAHTRHYMPVGLIDKGRDKTTLVFDTWANVGEDELLVQWDCNLDTDAYDMFVALTKNLTYLGRSESWVEAAVQRDKEELARGVDVVPCVTGLGLRPGWEQVSLMAPVSPADYVRWRDASVAGLSPLDSSSRTREVKSANAKHQRDRLRAESSYPIDLIDCLERDTSWWTARGWSQPPGSQRVLYWRPSNALATDVPRLRRRVASTPVSMALLALTADNGSPTALPLPSRALPQGELLHAALVSRAGNGHAVHCPELTGKDDDGLLLRGHRHAHILSLDLDGDGHLDHVLIYAPMRLGAVAQQAIRSIRRTFTKGGVGVLHVALAGLGELEDLRRLPAPFGKGIERILGPVGGASVWSSVTPFVPPRHCKRNGRNTLEGQITAELASRGKPPLKVEILPWSNDMRMLRHAVRVRKRGGVPPPSDFGVAVRVEFAHPEPGPIAIGYGAHFGLGLFGSAQR